MIETGDVLAFTHNGLKSWGDFESQLVRIFTRSEYTHVGIAWAVGERVLIIEAAVPEVRIYPLSLYNEFFLIKTFMPLKEDSLNTALSYVGQKYSKMEAIRGLLSNPRKASKWQCAELVQAVLNHNGLYLDGKATPSGVVAELLGTYNLQLISVRG